MHILLPLAPLSSVSRSSFVLHVQLWTPQACQPNYLSTSAPSHGRSLLFSSSRCNENQIILAPDRMQRDLRAAEKVLEGRVRVDIGAVMIEMLNWISGPSGRLIMWPRRYDSVAMCSGKRPVRILEFGCLEG